MTRHFSPKLLKIAEKYFETVTQSRAEKKARTATLSGKLNQSKTDLIDSFEFKGNTYRQYWGVFSAKHIDYATQFFLDHLKVEEPVNKVLDLASGNGVIAKEIFTLNKDLEIHLLDDSLLAVESAKLNLSGPNIFHHLNNNLSDFENDYFELIVSNPPFHFEYEININVPLKMFEECFRCLKPNGTLQIVANKHLNYATHLKKWFSVKTIAENESFVVYCCRK